MEKDKIAENELDIISRLECPNVVKYFDHFYLIVSEFGKDVSYLCLVTEFCSVLLITLFPEFNENIFWTDPKKLSFSFCHHQYTYFFSQPNNFFKTNFFIF